MDALLQLRFDHAYLLPALLLAALPWLRHPADTVRFSWTGLVPADPLAAWILRLQKLAAAIAIGAIVLGLAGPYRPSVTVERVGHGSEIVLLLDRSRSMDEPFVTTRRHFNPHYQDRGQSDWLQPHGEAKGKAARRTLAAFAAGRPHDLIAYTVFSGFPIRVLDFTQNRDMVQAAIAAGDVGHGLAETDIGRALLDAAQMWRDRPWRGARTIVLVSDGGARLDDLTRQQLAVALRRYHVAVNFLHIRSFQGHSLEERVSDEDAEKIPSISLHRYLGGLGIAYRGYEAGNAAALRRAVQDIGERENTPIVYEETLPRRAYGHACFVAALLAALAWLLALAGEWKRPWPRHAT